ncbi:MAG: hypothetical protein II702_01715 [Clostridia bacterium]|nr:hypothetical protein [Clostridia bacterium]
MNNNRELVFRLVNTEYLQPYFKTDVDLSGLSKISLEEISGMSELFLPIAGVMKAADSLPFDLIKEFGTDTLYAAKDKAGESMKLTSHVKGETDSFIGSYIKDNKTAQARFSEISLKDFSGGIVKIDPVTVAVAAEMIYLNHEINVIKQQQEDMFQYLLAEKRAELEGSLAFLINVMNDFKDNYDNETYKTSMHIKVLDIKQQAEQAVTASRNHIESFLKKDKDDFNRLSSYYQNYQIAVYLYALSSFAEVVVLENFNSDYLKKVLSRIDEISMDYRAAYTDTYNYIADKSEKSPQSVLLSTGSKFGKIIGEKIAKTPVGDKTKIDEKIIDGSDLLMNLKDSSVSRTLNEFCNYKETRVQPFVRAISAIDEICNGDAVLFDSQNMYIPKLV